MIGRLASRRDLERTRAEVSGQAPRRVLGSVLTIDANPRLTQQLSGGVGIAERYERMKCPARNTSARQRRQTGGLGDRGRVENHRAACDPTVACGKRDLVDGIVELWIADADE